MTIPARFGVRLPAAILACLALAPRPALGQAAASSGTAAVQWVPIPGGSFMMWPNEFDGLRRVEVKPFQMAKTPVTNAQYKDCVKAGECTPPRGYGQRFDAPDQPVVGVTWTQANVFSKWAGGALPSETQWEYAARSLGKDQRFAPTCQRAVIYDKALGFGCGKKATGTVCSKPKGNTDQGLCDMAGNVLEWVSDLGPEKNEVSRFLRGTSWDDSNIHGLPSANRENRGADDEADYIGFRPVK